MGCQYLLYSSLRFPLQTPSKTHFSWDFCSTKAKNVQGVLLQSPSVHSVFSLQQLLPRDQRNRSSSMRFLPEKDESFLTASIAAILISSSESTGFLVSSDSFIPLSSTSIQPVRRRTRCIW